MKLSELKNKRILIVGFGREGRAVLDFLQNIECEVKVADKDAVCDYNGEDYLRDVEDFDIVIKSPGVPPHTKGLEKSKRITSATEIFLNNCPGKIIGITGSKGKSTTSNAVYMILKEAGFLVEFLGNIGTAAISCLGQITSETYCVMELSSYQLNEVSLSPHIAVFTSFFPEHLNYHGGLESYRKAKGNIYAYQNEGDFLFVPEGLDINARSRVVKCGIDLLGQESRLLGLHNKQNLSLAICVARHLKISDEVIKNAISKINPLPHRLNLIRDLNGVAYYDDAISTTPDSTISALKSLNNVGTLFLGGYDRGLDFDGLAQLIVSLKISNLVFFPDNGERIFDLLKDKYDFRYLHTKSMKEGVDFAYLYTKKGQAVLLSTASPSFSLWKNYEEKGDEFVKYVNALV
jgi:UDP-N-acetylmuramoylalanine--D-glutamate ligase